jgi:hypothetical protein
MKEDGKGKGYNIHGENDKCIEKLGGEIRKGKNHLGDINLDGNTKLK